MKTLPPENTTEYTGKSEKRRSPDISFAVANKLIKSISCELLPNQSMKVINERLNVVNHCRALHVVAR